MKTITVSAVADAQGTLHVDVPVGVAEGKCEIVIRVNHHKAPDGWLPGFLDCFREGWQGEELVRGPQGEYTPREPLQ